VKIDKIMQRHVITLQVDEPLINAVEATASERVRHLPILDGDRLVGIMSDRDITRATPSPLLGDQRPEYARILNTTLVSRIMRSAPITAPPDASLAEVVRLMVDNKIGAVPVVSDGRIVGIVSELDIMRTFLRMLEVIE